MSRKWMPITAGILDIINGASATIFGLFLLFMALTWANYRSYPWYNEFVGPLLLAVGVLAIVGGIYAFIRKVWLLALTGAIAGFLSTSWWLEYWVNIGGYGLSLDTLRGLAGIPAIVAIVLTILSRKEFK